MADIDLLVSRDQVLPAIVCLQAAGYHRTGLEVRPGDRLLCENDLVLRRDGEGRLPVELHWSLFDSPFYQEGMATEWFWKSRIESDDHGVTTLGTTAQILHLTGHLMLHHQGRGLLWWHDIASRHRALPGRR